MCGSHECEEEDMEESAPLRSLPVELSADRSFGQDGPGSVQGKGIFRERGSSVDVFQ